MGCSVSVPFGVLSNINFVPSVFVTFSCLFPSPSGFYLISIESYKLRVCKAGFPSPSGFYLISIECGCCQNGCTHRVSVPFGVLSNININLSCQTESAEKFPSPSGFYLISILSTSIHWSLDCQFPSPSGFYLISIFKYYSKSKI